MHSHSTYFSLIFFEEHARTPPPLNLTLLAPVNPQTHPPCAKTCLWACKDIWVRQTFLSEAGKFKIACEWQESRRPVTTFFFFLAILFY